MAIAIPGFPNATQGSGLSDSTVYCIHLELEITPVYAKRLFIITPS